jgi:hypothetical protein
LSAHQNSLFAAARRQIILAAISITKDITPSGSNRKGLRF